MTRLYCQNGNHDWDRPVTRGRVPLSCPKHPTKTEPLTPEERSRRRIAGKRAKAKERAKAEQAEKFKRYEDLRERMRLAEVEVDKAYLALVKAGGVNKASAKVFDRWLHADMRLMSYRTAIRTAEETMSLGP